MKIQTKKLLAVILSTILLVTVLAIPVLAAYPSSPNQPGDLKIMSGTVIGNAEGWPPDNPNPDVGAWAAFDGDEYSFFDPLGAGDGYCGMKMSEPYILKEIRIHPRENFLNRFNGAAIYGFNADVDPADFNRSKGTLIWESMDDASDFEWQIIKEDKFKVKGEAFTHFAYYNDNIHGDVGEVELWGVTLASTAAPEPAPVVEAAPAAVVEAAPAAAPAPAPAPAAVAPAAVTSVPATGNTGIIVAFAALAAVTFVTTKAIKRKR